MRIGRIFSPTPAVRLRFPLLSLLFFTPACAAGYRIVERGEVLEARISIDTLVGDALLIAVPLLLSIFYNAILRKLTGEHDQEFFSLGRILFAVMAGFAAVQLLYPHLLWRVRVEPDGLRKVTKDEDVFIPFNEMVAVRNNFTRTKATPEGIIEVPRLEVVGSHDDLIYVEEEQVGRDVYARIAQEVGQRYYGRPALIAPSETKAEEKTEAAPDPNPKP